MRPVLNEDPSPIPHRGSSAPYQAYSESSSPDQSSRLSTPNITNPTTSNMNKTNKVATHASSVSRPLYTQYSSPQMHSINRNTDQVEEYSSNEDLLDPIGRSRIPNARLSGRKIITEVNDNEHSRV